MGIDIQEYQNRFGSTSRNRGVVMTLDMAKLGAALQDIEKRVDAAVRPAAYAGIRVLYDRVRDNVETMLTQAYLPPGKQRDVILNAVYHAFMDDYSSRKKKYYRVSWNRKKAPHAHLVEWGHLLTYRVYFGKDGHYHTMVKPKMLKTWLSMKARGYKSVPKNRRDEFFIRHPSPKHIAPRPFMREAMSQFGRALNEVERRFFEAYQQGVVETVQ